MARDEQPSLAELSRLNLQISVPSPTGRTQTSLRIDLPAGTDISELSFRIMSDGISQGEATPTVMLVAGKDSIPVEYVTPKDLVCQHSKELELFFESAEGASQICRLDDVSHNILGPIYYWMTSHELTITTPIFLWSSMSDIAKIILTADQIRFFQIYLLAGKLGIWALQTHIIDKLNQIFETCQSTPLHLVRYIYETTPVGSELRAFIVERAASTLTPAELQAHNWSHGKDDLPSDFLSNIKQIYKNSRLFSGGRF